jgi:hypothetical protein
LNKGLIAVAIVAVIGFAAAMFFGRGSGTPALHNLPNEYAGLKQVALADGDDGLKAIDKLHGKSIKVTHGYKVTYAGDGEEVTVWGAGTDSEKDAKTLLMDMVNKMNVSTNMPFTKPVAFPYGDYTLYYSEGMGAKHYYYAKGKLVFWIELKTPREAELMEKILKDF